LTDAVLEACGERIRAAALAKRPLAIRGGGTKDFYGEAIVGRVGHDGLDTSAYAGIVDYDSTELVVTARAGTRLAEVIATLRASGQMLASEPPAFGANATLGGAVAAGLSGPRRPYAGALRDIVLGVRMFDGRGQDLSFGGRVMKNVAGFDLSRLLTGSLGTLGVLTEISLKCIPLPKLEATRLLECEAPDALRMMNQWTASPAHLGNVSSGSSARGTTVRRGVCRRSGCPSDRRVGASRRRRIVGGRSRAIRSVVQRGTRGATRRCGASPSRRAPPIANWAASR
jgi:glycolate oxidase FAD binding subunit